ncbi:MAG: cell wall metabolism sensor histidine kinase WalK, partial [Chloroflexi bacterium]|nr:cell wall metabolism sensor histidine kinase WalK [Chloroflexota bacterium]
RPLRQVQVHTARLGRTILLVALGASLVAALLAVAMAGRITRPIRHLTQEAQRIAAGDLGRPVVADSGDEVADLAHAFNRMGGRLQERMERLAEEQRLLSTVLSRMADGAIITDAGGRVRLINPAAARLLESPADAVGRSFAQVARNHQLVDLWRAASEAGEAREATIEVLRPNLFLRAIVTPLDADSTGETLTIVQDLTQVRRLETVRRDFVSNISHELRNPLASLKALVETLRDGAIEDPDAAERFLNSAETEVDALTQMVQELLELSRIESGRVSLHPEPVTAKALLARPAERLRPQAERAGVAIETAVPPDLPLALADVERLQQVIINIVHNAIKFTPAGGRISLSAQAAGNEVVLSIRDTGAGIPAKDLPRIFERFFKTDRARSGGGTGLGLAIAKHIVQAHGGRIWAESVEGRGSAFHIALPVTSEEGSDP